MKPRHVTNPPLVMPPTAEFNFARSVLDLNKDRSAKTAYIDDSGEMTYGELADSVRRFGSGLRALGIGAKQRVLLLVHDRNEWPIAFLGALHAGVIPIPINTSLTRDDLAYIVEHSGVTAAIVSHPLLETFQSAIHANAKNLCARIIVVGRPTADPADQDAHDFQRVLANGDAHDDGIATLADEVAFWLYSSGSTGRPKGVVHTHANLYWTSELYAKPVLGLRHDDVVFSAAKLFFAYGLGNSLTFPLQAGATTLLCASRPTPAAVFECLTRNRATIFCAAPTLYAGMLACEALPSADTLRLRLCTSAGEPLPREVGERFTRHFGIPIIDGLGSTEMLHIFVSNRPDAIAYGTTGKPVDGYQVELRDENGTVLTPGPIGDLWVRGPSRALMYWNDEAKTRETFFGPWLRTGDKYTQRDDGALVYSGRNDDMLRISGQYVSPFEVESTLSQHELVLESAVVGVLDALGICKCKAFVVLRNNLAAPQGLAEELKLFVKSRLAPYKRPHHVEFVSELPKTVTGKIQRFKLRASQTPTTSH